jgi:hypothetical protein
MEEMNVLSLDSEDILEYKLDGQFPIWPLVRFDLLTAISRQGAAGSPQRRVSAKTRVGNLLRGLLGIRIGRARIQFISSTLFCVKQSDTYTNVLEDYFFEVFPDGSFVYENLDPLDYSRRLPRKNHQISTAFTYVDLLGKGIARFFRAGANGDIDAFCRHLSAKGVRQDFVDETRVKLFRYAKQLRTQRLLYRIFLKLSSPQLLFVNCGAYGASNAILISEAKSLGIRVAEMQHGVIDASHYAYNYGEEIKRSAVYGRYLPDYLLTFGEFWNGCTNIACPKVAVGHPHLSKIREQFVDKSVPGSFLIISQWTITDELIGAALRLRKIYPDAQIMYRLHPVEVLTAQQSEQLRRNDIWMSDRHSDIYAEFAAFENIVGCYSTALYEAKAFGKNVLILNHPLAFRYGFDKIGRVIDSDHNPDVDSMGNNFDCAEKSFFYQMNFDKSYSDFVRQHVQEAVIYAS